MIIFVSKGTQEDSVLHFLPEEHQRTGEHCSEDRFHSAEHIDRVRQRMEKQNTRGAFPVFEGMLNLYVLDMCERIFQFIVVFIVY